MNKRVSVKDIAQKLNISLSTVHKALTGKGGVSEERRKEVIETAKEMGYVVNSVAQTLARKDIIIGIIMPSEWHDYFAEMKSGMEEEIHNLSIYKVRGLFYFLSSDLSSDNAQNALLWIRDKKIDALIYCPSIYSLDDEFVRALNNLGIPVFMAGDSNADIRSISDIVTDAELSGKLAADFLRCIHGNTLKAAVFMGSLTVASHVIKTNSFRKRVEAFGGRVTEVFETMDDSDKTYELMKESCTDDINAIYVTTATSAPVCRYICENNLQGKISLVCTDLFDELRDYMRSGVVSATIYQNQEKLGKIAVRRAYEYLVEKNSYGNEDFTAEKKVYIRPSLFLLADIE